MGPARQPPQHRRRLLHGGRLAEDRAVTDDQRVGGQHRQRLGRRHGLRLGPRDADHRGVGGFPGAQALVDRRGQDAERNPEGGEDLGPAGRRRGQDQARLHSPFRKNAITRDTSASGPAAPFTMKSSAPWIVRASFWLSIGARVYSRIGMSTHSMVALIMLITSLPAIPAVTSSSRTITSGRSAAMAARPSLPSSAVRTGTSAFSRAATASARLTGSSSISRTVFRRRLRTTGARAGRPPPSASASASA